MTYGLVRFLRTSYRMQKPANGVAPQRFGDSLGTETTNGASIPNEGGSVSRCQTTMPEEGFEPSPRRRDGILSPACLPFHHSGVASSNLASSPD